MVYGIICLRCASTAYVGETERELGEKMIEHLRDVRLGKDNPINSHFGEKEHSQEDLINFCCDGKGVRGEAHRETDKRSPVDQTSRNYQTGWVQREGRSRPNSVLRTLCCILGPIFRVFGQGRHKPGHAALYIITLDLVFRIWGVVDCTVYVAK